MADSVFSPARRSGRQPKPSLKSLENATTKLNKHRFKQVFSSASDSEDSVASPEKSQEKPQILHENELVAGGKIFTFSARKKCEAVKTPHAVRNNFKKSIKATFLDESESDFSDSGSEYVASSEESETNSDSSEENTDPELVQKPVNIKPTAKRPTKSYTIKTEDYFSNHASKKILTSNHTLDKLETPRLPQDQLQKLLARVKLSGAHSTAKEKLINTNTTFFEKWMFLMHENMNILLYGLGSKKSLLNYFHEKYLKHLPTIVVNGFFPSLSIRDVLDGILMNLLELKENPANVFEACELIEKEFSYIPDTHLYLIVHNIEMLQSGKAQSVFAKLASVRNIHLMASIDHINAPLIWDHSKLSKFNFSWWDVTTFQNYVDETSFESSMMVQRTGALALSSLRNVFLSLTSNSKGIYLILAKYQLENGKKQYYQGLSFKDLYAMCREAFLVSSDLALRAQLSEFADHKMIRLKRAADCIEYVLIPIPNSVLQQFMAEQQST